MRQSEVLKEFAKLTDSQKETIRKTVMGMIQVNDNLNSCIPEVCPVCGAEHVRFYRRDIHGKKRRWCCSKCNHKFTYDSHTITSNLKIGTDVFVQICMDTLDMVPIRKTAEKLDISVQCVFNNRHKFLSLLAEILQKEEVLMTGTIEGDETYVLESTKGSNPENRKSRHRGGHSDKRGISHDQICIVTTTDRNGHEIFRAVGSAKPTTGIIDDLLAKHIEKGSIMYVDGAACCNDLSKKAECKVKHLIGHESYNKVEHLNTVNSIHSMIRRNYAFYRGVATKYLNRYMALFLFMRRLKDMDSSKKTETLIGTIKWFHCHITRESLKEQHLFSVNACY